MAAKVKRLASSYSFHKSTLDTSDHTSLTELSLRTLCLTAVIVKGNAKPPETQLGSLADVSSHMLPLSNSTGSPGAGEDGERVDVLQQGVGDDLGSKLQK